MDELERMLTERLRQPPTDVPGEVDAAILLRARRHFQRRRRRFVPFVAAAASILLGFLVWPRDRAPAVPRFDIVDAYVLATRLQQGSEVEPRWDVNQDGRVDREDVERIVQAAVTLGPRSG